MGNINATLEELQMPQISFVTATGLIEQTRNDLAALRTEKSWEKICQEADAIHEQMNENKAENTHPLVCNQEEKLNSTKDYNRTKAS